MSYFRVLVGGEGFEPSKAKPTDLQSVPFDRSGILPDFRFASRQLYRGLLEPIEGLEPTTG